VLTVSGCQTPPEPVDYSYTSPRFSISLDTDKEQQVKASFEIWNSGEDVFPADESFNAMMNLWDQSGELRSKIKVASVGEIGPDESIQLSTAHWDLTAGVYFVNWGTPEYGSVMGVFTVASINEQISLGASQFFPLKPAYYDIVADSAGSIQSFTMDENDTIILMGETPIPDMGHVFPLIFDANGLVEGMPTGQFASIADGRWRVEIPAGSVTLEPERMYSILLFTDDPAIGPSEPFVIHVSPPVQN
jgi:hypothetical protein